MILSTRNNKICINLFDLLIISILFSTNLEFGSKFYHNVGSSRSCGLLLSYGSCRPGSFIQFFSS